MALGIGIGIPFIRVSRGAAIDAQAQAHFDRVIADGGLVPSGLSGVNAFFTTVKSIYATSDITTAISVGLDAQVLGYKLGAGAGTTAGQAAQKLYSCSGASGDVVQTTAASQPLLLVHSGANYWQGVGVASNYVSTPNAAANQITDNLELTAQASLRWQSITATDFDLIGKFSGAAEGYILRYNGSAKTLVLVTNLGGFTTYSSTATITAVNDSILWVRVTRQRSNGEVKFFTSTDGITYTQLGATVSGSTAAINVGSSVVEIGSRNVGTTASTIGKIYRATISNSIGGAPVVDFNPNQYNAANSQTQWTSSTGEVWTINTGTAATGYKGQIVTKTTTQGDGIDDNLRASSFSINLPAVTSYMATRKYQNTTVGILYELGPNVASNSGIAAAINDGASRNAITINGNTANGKGYSSTNILNQLITCVGDTSVPANDEVLYFENNVQLAINITFANGNNTANINQSVLNVFSRNAASLFANAILNTFIIARQADNSTNRTAVYNYIRSINNSAF
jgi:hypothetical protein